MPMLHATRNPDHIAWPDFFDWRAFELDPAETGRDDQRLAEWVRVPRGAGARLERDAGTTDAGRLRRLEEQIDAHGSGKVIGRPGAGRL